MHDEQVLIEAIKAGDLGHVASLLDANPGLASARSDGVSAVLLAVYYGRVDIASALASRRDALDLFEACAIGDAARTLTILNEQPELLDAANTDGFTPLGLAAFFGHVDVVDLLLGLGATVDLPSHNAQRVTPLNSAAAGGHIEIVRLLLDRGANVNARQPGGFTPLHSAAQNGQPELVALLIERGADTQAATDEGRTPADFARESGSPAVVGILKKQP